MTYKSGDVYRYFCGVPVENNYVNTFFEENKIINGNYAIFQHKGAMCYLKDTINEIYKQTIPNDKMVLNQTEYFHFELYNYKFNMKAPVFFPMYRNSISSSPNARPSASYINSNSNPIPRFSRAVIFSCLSMRCRSVMQ
jgi:hypothetical protein